MQPLRQDSSLPQRRHRKMLKDGTSEVWPQDAEDVFLDGLREYWNSPWANFSRGRSRWRNQYLVDFLKKKGVERSKKQVASHIQVLRNMWKGHPEFTLVAGPEELSEGSSTSDRHSPSRRSSRLSSRSPSRRRSSISHSSPPSTPTSYDSELSESAPSANRRPTSLNLSPHSLPQISSIKTEHLHSPHGLLFEPSGLSAVPEIAVEQHRPLIVNRVAGLCLWAESMQPNYIDVDALPFAGTPASPGSPAVPPPSSPQIPSTGIVRTSLRVKLQMPSDGMNGTNAVGFSGAVAFASPLSPSAEVMTRVHVDNVCISREIAPLIPVHDPAAATGAGAAMQERFVALLPDSWLTRCCWLDTGNKKTIVTQQVVVDAEALFVVIYDLHRVRTTAPSAELVLWNKHVDNAPPQAPALLPLPMMSPSASRFGGSAANSYLYSTAASLANHAQHTHTHAHPPHAQQHSHVRGHSSPTLGHSVRPTNTASGGDTASGSGGSGSNQTTPTHTSFPALASPISPNVPSGTSSSGSSSARSCTGFGQGGVGMGMVSGVGVLMHGHSMGSGIGFENEPWTTSLLPLF
ncbi:hypothetical protein DFH11DRAFT_1724466 [Phellopilus nigrolimitatus]|nr:hypothetical protein DFH11DRAFT_1724466 [Phellopilus nigrolimitatus]